MGLKQSFRALALATAALTGSAQAGLARTDVGPTESNPSSVTIDTKSYGPVHMYKNNPKTDYFHALAVGQNGKVDMTRVDCSDVKTAYDAMNRLDPKTTLEQEHRDVINVGYDLCFKP